MLEHDKTKKTYPGTVTGVLRRYNNNIARAKRKTKSEKKGKSRPSFTRMEDLSFIGVSEREPRRAPNIIECTADGAGGGGLSSCRILTKKPQSIRRAPSFSPPFLANSHSFAPYSSPRRLLNEFSRDEACHEKQSICHAHDDVIISRQNRAQ